MNATIGRRRFLSHAVAASTAAGGIVAIPQRQLRAAPPTLPPTVIDTHTHFYDPTRSEGLPWPGKGGELYRPVLPAEWQTLVKPLSVTGTVVVEAGSWVEDNQWLLDLASRHDRERLPGMLGIVGVVGSLPLGDPGCDGLIDRFAKQKLYRGVRVNGDKLLAGLADKTYAADVGRLAGHDLSIDINGGKVFAAAAAAAAQFPSLRIRGPPSSPIRSRLTAATASATSSILLLMPGDSSVFARIASVEDRPHRRRGHPRGKLCPSRPPRSPFLVGHHRDASRSLGHVVHAVKSHQTCRRAIRRHPVGSPSRTPLRAASAREDAAPQDRVGEPRELARVA